MSVFFQLNTTVKLTQTDEKTIRSILASCELCILYDVTISQPMLPPTTDKIHNCDVMIREDVSFGRGCKLLMTDEPSRSQLMNSLTS